MNYPELFLRAVVAVTIVCGIVGAVIEFNDSASSPVSDAMAGFINYAGGCLIFIAIALCIGCGARYVIFGAV